MTCLIFVALIPLLPWTGSRVISSNPIGLLLVGSGLLTGTLSRMSSVSYLLPWVASYGPFPWPKKQRDERAPSPNASFLLFWPDQGSLYKKNLKISLLGAALLFFSQNQKPPLINKAMVDPPLPTVISQSQHPFTISSSLTQPPLTSPLSKQRPAAPPISCWSLNLLGRGKNQTNRPPSLSWFSLKQP